MEHYVTKEGLEKMKQELGYLKITKRMEVASRIRAAIAMGDLSENFEYSAAKEEQEFMERRISELGDLIHEAVLVDASNKGGTAKVGSRLSIKIGKETMEITLTGAQEADPMNGKISIVSPLGSALLGKKKGDVVEVQTPGGKAEYTVLDIS